MRVIKVSLITIAAQLAIFYFIFCYVCSDSGSG